MASAKLGLRRTVRVIRVLLPRPSANAVARFYAGAAAPFLRMLPIGMELKGKRVAPETVFTSVLAKPDYKHTITQSNDTADPGALIRKALSAI